MNAKKLITLAMLVLVAIASVMAKGSSRKDIDAYLKSYEQFVVSAEKAAKSNNMSDLISLYEKAEKLLKEGEKVQLSDNWTMADSQKLLDLTNRYTNTMSTMSGSGSFSF